MLPARLNNSARDGDILGHIQIREHLLRDALERGRGHLPAFVRAKRRIQLHQYGDRRRVNRSEADEGCDQLVTFLEFGWFLLRPGTTLSQIGDELGDIAILHA